MHLLAVYQIVDNRLKVAVWERDNRKWRTVYTPHAVYNDPCSSDEQALAHIKSTGWVGPVFHRDHDIAQLLPYTPNWPDDIKN